MKKCVYASVFLLMITMVFAGWCSRCMYELKNNIVRLHVIANSDSEIDQNIKLAVRDKILELAYKSGKTPSEEQIVKEADKLLLNAGIPYTTKVTYGKCYVNRRNYDNFVLPEGIYTAARVELGEAKGKNWWCVLSPPLCFTKSAFGESTELSKTLSTETNNAVSGITIKLKFLEWASRLSQK